MIGSSATASASASTINVLSTSSWTDSGGYIHIVGEVQNVSSDYQESVEIDFGFYDASNNLLATDLTFTEANTIAPGEMSPFVDIFTPPAGYSHYAISNVGSTVTSAPPNHNFAVAITNVFIDTGGYQHIVGTVTNNNSATSTFVDVIFTMYDCAGNVVDGDYTYVQGTNATIAPSPASANFELIRSSDAPAAVTVDVFADSLDAPDPYALPAHVNHPLAAPGSPTSVAALGGESSAEVDWGATTCSPVPVTSYTVTASPGGLTATVDGNTHSATISGLTDATSYNFTVAASNSVGSGPGSAASNSVTPGRGAYVPLPPSRILDTRSGLGAPVGQLGPGASLDVQATGNGGVPSTGVAAVVLNVTVTDTTAGSYLTVWPTGMLRPVASNLNWTAGRTVPNLVEVAVGVGGKVSVFNPAGYTSVIFDVAGYVVTPVSGPVSTGLYHPVVPNRVLDTRDGTGGVAAAKLGPGQTSDVRVAGTQSVPSSGAAAVVLNVTVTGATAASYLTVFPTGVARPVASNLNFVAGQTVPNRVIVQLGSNATAGTNGWVSFYNPAGSVDVIADVAGWFTDSSNSAATGGRFVGLKPARILDTRNGTGGVSGPLNAGQVIAATVAGQGGVPTMNAFTPPTAVVLNVTVTDTTAGSYLTAWPDQATRPTASDLNWVPGLTVPNLVVVKLGPNGLVDFYSPAGSTDLIVDVVGWYG